MKYVYTPGSSGSGASYYRRLTSCPLKVRNDQERAEVDELPPSIGVGGASIGILYHIMMEIWLGGDRDFLPGALELVTEEGEEVPVEPESLLEACRLFEYTRNTYPPELWGTIIDLELTGRIDKPGGTPLFGGLPFTYRIDVVSAMEEEHCKLAQAHLGLELKPGRYLWDHKTDRALNANLHARYLTSPQLLGYLIAYNYDHPYEECAGLIVTSVIKRREPCMIAVFVPPPDAAERQWVEYYYQGVSVMERQLSWWPNLSECHNPLGSCPYAGTCMRL